MDIEYIDHVGIAVKDLESASGFLENALGAKKYIVDSWEYEGQSFTWAYFSLGDKSRLELIHSSDPDNFINRYIEKNGEGVHHITIKVKSLEVAIAELRQRGIDVVDINTSNPTWKEAFISPRDAFGTLIQLAEFKEQDWEP